MDIIIANNRVALAGADVTVEAEYGDHVAKGSVLTMAHHGPRAGQPAPCSYPNGCAGDPEDLLIGISHVDLDTVGGVMAVLGRKPEAPGFWALAEFVDLNGPHKLGRSGASTADLRRLHAYWAFSRDARVFAPRDGTAGDVTAEVMHHVEAVEKILQDDQEMLAAGDQFRAGEDALNRESFLSISPEGVILRLSEHFVNHLYTTPAGHVGQAVVAHKPTAEGDLSGGAITVSLADPHPTINVGNLLRELFGPEAGGHAGIGGSPRGQPMAFSEAVRVTAVLSERLAGSANTGGVS